MNSTSLSFRQPLLSSIKLHWSSDGVTISLFILAASFLYLTRGTRQPKGHHLLFLSPQIEDGLVGSNKPDSRKAIESRNINDKIKKNNSDVVIFWGSQSGKAEKVAQDLGRQCRKRYGIKAIVADLSNYDHEHFQNFPQDKYTIFVVSTFGEGDPPDNAADLFDYLASLKKDNTKRLQNLHYYAFGLGDRKYYSYNRFVDVVDESLSAAGAHRLGFVGKADDSLPEDNSLPVWTDSVLTELSGLLGKSEKSSVGTELEPELQLVDSKNSSIATWDPMVSIHGQQQQITKATLREATMLSKGGHRPDYLHIEFDISKTRTAFSTGDHVAIWPVNPDDEVQRLADLFKWNESILSTPVSVKARQTRDEDEEDTGLVSNFPTHTTRRALLSHYLDINGAITPETVLLIANYASDENAKGFLQSLITPDGKLAAEVKDCYLTVGKLMQLADSHGVNTWPGTLFECLLQALPRIQPRYFSIASSPVVDPSRLAITVSVVAKPHSNTQETFHGLATNYLYAHRRALLDEAKESSDQQLLRTRRNDEPRYHLGESGSVFMKIRPSTFKMPTDVQTPIIMVAAGSGIAPFRAFVQERAHAVRAGKKVGRMVLFFGIRSMQEDLLYEDEWNGIKTQLHGASRSESILNMHLAISRPATGTKKYAQDIMYEHKDDVLTLLKDNVALYICGSMKLSAGVKDKMKQMLETEYSWDSVASERYLDDLRGSGRLREDVWA